MEWNFESKKGGIEMAITLLNQQMQNQEKSASGRSLNLRVNEVNGWQNPKTNWKPTDRFNITDYNRIRSNIQWLYEKCKSVSATPDYLDMGSNIYDFTEYWNVDYFNAMEKNLESINKLMYKKNDIGNTLTFYENSVFIDFNELNRIEYACLSIFKLLEIQEMSVRHIPFRLGQFNALR